ncbi:Helix-turn-helix domain protein (plasmid) [Duffyella gerundensis]|uniref:STY4528 family pathogenicity island replication protein n=1 Tax=Duffyella gerundensis TaxID=1619313 RepID=UPI001CE33609|nr:STY4528 family pathogenicity island replication protein [Duffyella gerundensis]UCB33463.1 Helix-turn-helix domain protein [Duffyella gerundensis]
MKLPDDSLINHAVEKMNDRLLARDSGEQSNFARGGLLFMGNVHDALPRRLLLDTRLSPLDKMAWIIIRLHAQHNDGAVFPSYDDLQLQLATPGKGKASRETISRVLLMLRITGWLSLCKRVRDDKGRIRGNIYAQHDEPLTFADAELLDPRWLQTVAEACFSINKTISQTAKAIINDVCLDPAMRHHRSHLAAIESRLGSVQDPAEMKKRMQVKHPGSESELSENSPEILPNSDSEPGKKVPENNRVREPNGYVRIVNNNTKNTYVERASVLPEKFASLLSEQDRKMLSDQLQALQPEPAQLVLQNLSRAMKEGSLQNPVGWLLTVLKKARKGELYQSQKESFTEPAASRPEHRPVRTERPAGRQVTDDARVRDIIRRVRSQIHSDRHGND